MKSSDTKLDDLRNQIDAIDDQILDLLEERAGAVADIAAAKKGASLPTYDPTRERAVLERLSARAGKFPAEAIRSVYREIMSACLALQSPLRVAFLGPEGTFSHAAARAFFGLAASYCEAATIEGVFDAVSRGEAQHGVVPIENSSEGAVSHAADALARSDLLICAELELDVAQCLLTRATSLGAIERVVSHPQALGQCRVWLAKNLPSALLVQTTSTAAAVREAAADPHTAAIGGKIAAEMHELPVFREAIQDHADNVTRFVMLGKKDAARTGNDKTSIAFSLSDGRGALMRVLEIFESESINLSRIESRPSHEKKWDYVFLADIEGHKDDANVASAMTKLAAKCPFVRHLGSYPRFVRR